MTIVQQGQLGSIKVGNWKALDLDVWKTLKTFNIIWQLIQSFPNIVKTIFIISPIIPTPIGFTPQVHRKKT